MSVQAMTWVLEHSESRLGDRLVLLSIANHANRVGENAWPSIETLALESRMSPRQVQRAIQRLEALGELEVQRGTGPNGTHRYRLTQFHYIASGGDKLSASRGDKLSPQGGDKSGARGVTNRAKTMSDLSPKPSLEPSLEPSMHSRARAGAADNDLDHAEFLRIKAAYPPFPGRQNWIRVEHECRYLVEQGRATWDQLHAGVERYAAYVAGGGHSDRYVLNPVTFFTGGDDPWRQEWKLPDGTSQPNRKPSIIEQQQAATAAWLSNFD